jgi:hypothetical protein
MRKLEPTLPRSDKASHLSCDLSNRTALGAAALGGDPQQIPEFSHELEP